MLDQSFFVSCPNPQVVREAGLGASVVATAAEGTKKDGGTRPHVAGRGKYGSSHRTRGKYSSLSPVGGREL